MLGLRQYQGTAVDLFQGDITTFACDAMVNAANERLAGGGGVDGAIHRVGGPEIMEECKRIGSCPTGTAVSTTAGRLPASWVIHTVGPVWQDGDQDEARLLAAAYRSSLQEADRLGARHVASAAISTGVYGYPLPEAAATSMQAVRSYLDGNRHGASVKRITLVLFNSELYAAFQDALFNTFPEEV